MGEAGDKDLREAVERMRTRLAALGCPVAAESADPLARYAAMLLEWNRLVNLVSRKDEHAVVEKHMFHSLVVRALVDFPCDAGVFDLGTGGGLPGLPLAVVMPRAYFVLCDASAKKIRAVQAMADALGLGNVRCLAMRAEDAGRDPLHAGRYDIVLARAAAHLEKLIRWSRPLLRAEGGRLIAWKGGDLAAEMRRALMRNRKLSFEVAEYDLPPGEASLGDGKKIVEIRFDA
ncbi:MAG: 16S rRNA (guanine(527)-N(7))-methyltransferase RsmG [Bacteroidota bacterium]|nr:16S rRNA (guanine(527)-N(7))-methyltransferase RsmG [Bacteroidota bacterium]